VIARLHRIGEPDTLPVSPHTDPISAKGVAELLYQQLPRTGPVMLVSPIGHAHAHRKGEIIRVELGIGAVPHRVSVRQTGREMQQTPPKSSWGRLRLKLVGKR